MRLAGLVEADRRELLLVDAEQQPAVVGPCGHGLARGPPSSVICAGSSRSFGPVGPCQAAALRRTKSSMPSPRLVGSGEESIAGQRAEEVHLADHDAAARTTGRHQLRDLAVDLGVERVAEPQLEPGAEDVAHRRPEVGPPGGRDQQVHAEREARAGPAPAARARGRRSRRAACSSRPRRGTRRRTRRRPGPRARRGAVGLDRVDALGAEVGLAAVHDALSPPPRSGVRRRARSGCRCRRRGAARSAARTCRHRSRARRTGSPAGWWSSPGWRPSCAAACSCRCAGRRRPTAWPAAPVSEIVIVSRRCSRGRSTVPSGIVSPPAAATSGRPGRAAAAPRRSGISWSRVSGTSSGGSHTWWAAGPWPDHLGDRDVEQRLLLALLRRPAAPRPRPRRARARAPRRS